MKDGLFRCISCNYKCSVTSGTIFEGTRKPLAPECRPDPADNLQHDGSEHSREKTCETPHVGGTPVNWIPTLNESLRLLRTDHVDLYQFHGVQSVDEVDTILGPGGAMETFVRAQRDGKARFLGFSAHSEEAALALIERVDFFTSILFPINWVTWNTGKFGPRVVQAAVDKGLAILALKSLAKRRLEEGEIRKWPKSWYYPVETYEEAELALRFTLSRPVTAAVSPGHVEFLRWAIDAAAHVSPLSAEEEKLLAERAKELVAIFEAA